MPHFFVDDNFHDSKEVMAIPADIRNEAVGLWTRCGAWSANKLTDGFVPTEVLRGFGARNKIVDALVSYARLCDRCGRDGIILRNWQDWQKTRQEVEKKRARDAARKRTARKRSTSVNGSMSARDSARDSAAESAMSPRAGDSPLRGESPTRGREGSARPSPPRSEIAVRSLPKPDCSLCDEDNYLPSGRVCDHIDRSKTANTGRAAIKNAMGWT